MTAEFYDQLVEACHQPAVAAGHCDAAAATAVHRYGYDAAGNRLEAVTNEDVRVFAYDDADRLASVTAADGTVSVVLHDANGNRLADGDRRYRYDLAGHLAGVEMLATGVEVAYRYDGDGVRLTSTAVGPGLNGEDVTALTWDVNQPLAELAAEHTGDGAPLRRYTHTPHGPLAVADGSGTMRLHADALGSVTATTDDNGALAAAHRYDPWGAPLQGSEAPLGFSGQHHDPHTGLVHLRARDYDPLTARFLSADPHPGVLEDPFVAARVYVGNRPTVFTDPAGLLCMIGTNPNGTCRGAAPARQAVQSVHLTADVVAIATGGGTLACSAVCAPAVPVLGMVSGLAGAVSSYAGAALAADHCVAVRLEGSCGWAVAGVAIGWIPGATGSVAQRAIWNLGGSRVQRRALMGVVGGHGDAAGGMASRLHAGQYPPQERGRRSAPSVRLA